MCIASMCHSDWTHIRVFRSNPPVIRKLTFSKNSRSSWPCNWAEEWGARSHEFGASFQNHMLKTLALPRNTTLSRPSYFSIKSITYATSVRIFLTKTKMSKVRCDKIPVPLTCILLKTIKPSIGFVGHAHPDSRCTADTTFYRFSLTSDM